MTEFICPEEDEELAARFAGRGLIMGEEADFPRLGRGDEEADEAGFGLGCACLVGVVCTELMGEGCAEQIGEVCAEGIREVCAERIGEGCANGAGGCAEGCVGLAGEVWEACSTGEMPKMAPHWALILSRRC